MARAERNGPPALTPKGEREALELLRDPRLLERIVSDFHRVGLVGEEAWARQSPTPLSCVPRPMAR